MGGPVRLGAEGSCLLRTRAGSIGDTRRAVRSAVRAATDRHSVLTRQHGSPTRRPPRNAAPQPANHAERQIWVAAISRLLSELRRKSVHVHLVVLVVRP